MTPSGNWDTCNTPPGNQVVLPFSFYRIPHLVVTTADTRQRTSMNTGKLIVSGFELGKRTRSFQEKQCTTAARRTRASGRGGETEVFRKRIIVMTAEAAETSALTSEAIQKHGIVDVVVKSLVTPTPHGEDGDQEGDVDYEEKAVR